MSQNSQGRPGEAEARRFYGERYLSLDANRERIEAEAGEYRDRKNGDDFLEPVLYVSSRLKSPASAAEKCRRKGVALKELTDLVGVRIVCAFMSDVYEAAAWVRSRFEVVCEKDFYADPKPNGYRSLHMVVRTAFEGLPSETAEIQVRTIASDFWAALEHQIKYKREIPDEDLLVGELRDCACDILSADIRMDAIRTMVSSAERRE